MTLEDKINHISNKAYKHRFSIYHRLDMTLIRIYFPDGTQHKETSNNLVGAIDQMVKYLNAQQ